MAAFEINRFRKDPWMIYVPLWSIWLILNFTGIGAWIGPTTLKQLLSGPFRTDLNPIFPVTWTSAVASFSFIFFTLLRKTSAFNAFSISAACQFGAASLFESIFGAIAFLVHGHPMFQGNPYYILMEVSWLIMPFCGIGYWSRNRFLYASMGVFVPGFVIWAFIGFPILSGTLSLFLNYVTKITAFTMITSLYLGHQIFKIPGRMRT
jgi:hypothetical protein